MKADTQHILKEQSLHSGHSYTKGNVLFIATYPQLWTDSENVCFEHLLLFVVSQFSRLLKVRI